MRLRDVLRRITGISTPVGGLSWRLEASEASQAKRVVTFLEDRRVLFAPDSLEVPGHCVESILKIREFLSSSLSQLTDDSVLAGNLKVMRSACRKFLVTVKAEGYGDILRYAAQHGHSASWTFYSALGELRGVFGISLALICERFDVEIEAELGSILPDLE